MNVNFFLHHESFFKNKSIDYLKIMGSDTGRAKINKILLSTAQRI